MHFIRNIIHRHATDNSWKDDSIPAQQIAVAEEQLKLMYSGNPPQVYVAATAALREIPGQNRLTLIDIGCGVGYYSEVIAALVGDRYEYTGADYSNAMLKAARRRYPGLNFLALDVNVIPLESQSYDVVLTGAMLVHLKDWKQGLCEVLRIARGYAVLHRTPVTIGPSLWHEEVHYGVPVFMNEFNEVELRNELHDEGFRIRFQIESGQNGPNGVLYFTYLCAREGF